MSQPCSESQRRQRAQVSRPPRNTRRRGGRLLSQRRCRDCGGVLRPYGDTGKWACERCHRTTELLAP